MSEMVDQVNRLVGDLLAAGDELLLPDVGTLYTERVGARRVSNRTVLPPTREVLFSEQQDGVSLTGEIARATGCDAAEAKDIYDRWLARTCRGETITIEGVGRLEAGRFVPTPEFDKRLNPQGRAPIRLQKSGYRFDWVLWVGIIAILVVLVLGTWAYFRYLEVRTAPETDAVPTEMRQPTEQPAEQTPVQQPAEQPQPTETRSSEPAASDHAAAVQNPDGISSLVPGRTYVVSGVFSTSENARRAAVAAEKRDGTIRCGVYPYGAKWMVAVFDAADAQAAERFIRECRDRYPDLWPYTAR